MAQKEDHRFLPSALPQNLLPLLARGLSVSSLPGSRSLGHQSGGLLKRVKAQPAAVASLAASDTGGDPAEPQPTGTHSGAPDTHTHTAEQQQEENVEADEELTTVDTVLGTDTETGSPPPGTIPYPRVVRLLRTGLHAPELHKISAYKNI